MKVPFSWLKDFVDIDINIDELSEKLVKSGFEIESTEHLRDKIKNVVVGKITEIKKHNNSDNLSVCQIDIGDKTVQIVTGAKNVNVGDLVPVALDNAVLPSGKIINEGELRGVLSSGMMCSGEELGLIEEDFAGAGAYGIWILQDDYNVGTDINDVIGNNDIVLDVAVTANRPDCNSILGISREVAAICHYELKMPDLKFSASQSERVENFVKITDNAADLCPRYMAAAVKDIKLETSPKIIRDRLKAVGIRPINNIVDITNYILVEIGQPMHAFDAKLLEKGEIIIRRAQQGEQITALDGKQYDLTDEDLTICDGVKPVAVAGIMGGEFSSVNDDTSTIIFESARFVRDSIRHTSRRLNLKSDSSARFEKGIDYISQEIGLKRALSIICKYNWGKIADGIIDVIDKPIEDNVLIYDYKKVNDIIGADIPKQTILDILNSLTLKTTEKNGIFTTNIPNYREDIEGVNDIAEEVIRLYGYGVVTPRMLYTTRGGKTEIQLRYDKFRSLLVGKGAFEILTYSFIPQKAFDMLNLKQDSELRNTIELVNPLSADFSVMRTVLAYSMIKTICNNTVRGNKEGRFFEIAKTYLPKQLPITELPIETNKLSIGLFGERENYYCLKNIVDDLCIITGIEVKYERCKIEFLHPGRSAEIIHQGKVLGFLGELHPDVMENFDLKQRVYIAEIDIQAFAEMGIDIKPYKAVSKYQATERDLALITPKEMLSSEILEVIKTTCSEILENVSVFDVYEDEKLSGAGVKSVAVKLVFRDSSRTLTDGDIVKEVNNVLEALKRINVCLR